MVHVCVIPSGKLRLFSHHGLRCHPFLTINVLAEFIALRGAHIDRGGA